MPLIPAGGRSDYDMRAHYIDDNQKHVFEPLMKRCLDKRPVARGTFENALEDIQLHLSKYSQNKHAATLEEKQVRLSLVLSWHTHL